MHSDPIYYLAAGLAVIVIGLSKGGFSGVSALALPAFALVESPVRAAAILLPIMVVQDWVGVLAFRRDFSGRNLRVLLPAAIVGIAIGWALARYVRDAFVLLAVGIISVAFVAYMLSPKRRRGEATSPGLIAGWFWGAISGFTSMISHSGAPPFMIYVAPQQLAPATFAGTAALFFAAANFIKIVPYFLLGQFSAANLAISATLLPLALASTLAGVWLVRRISAERFYRLILGVTFVIGLKLIYDATRALGF